MILRISWMPCRLMRHRHEPAGSRGAPSAEEPLRWQVLGARTLASWTLPAWERGRSSEAWRTKNTRTRPAMRSTSAPAKLAPAAALLALGLGLNLDRKSTLQQARGECSLLACSEKPPLEIGSRRSCKCPHSRALLNKVQCHVELSRSDMHGHCMAGTHHMRDSRH